MPSNVILSLSPHFAQTNIDSMNQFTKSFPLLAQSVIEKFYLQPAKKYLGELPSIPKENVKDGKIEREIKGGMHAARLGLLVGIFHQFMKEYFPIYIQTTLNNLSNELNLSEDQLLALLQFTGICQEVIWDEQSLYRNILIEQKINENLIALFIHCVVDHPNSYKQYLLEKGINPDIASFFDYIRIVLFLSKIFDAMSYKEELKLETPLEALSSLPGYDPIVHEEALITFAKQLHRIIREQGDMLFGCRIQKLNGETICLPATSHFRLKQKVQYEHAENVLGALFHAFKKDEFFAPYLPKSEISSGLYEGELAFNPNISGTTSIIFALLNKTDWLIDSSTDLLEKFGCVPFGGEITKGGLDNGNKCPPCFGRMSITSATSSSFYDLDRIIAHYTSFKAPNVNKVISKLKLKIIENSCFLAKEINVISVLLAKSKQLGADLYVDVFAGESDANAFTQEVAAIIQLFYLYLLIGKYIYPNLRQVNAEEKEKLSQQFMSRFALKNMIKKVIASNVDVKKAYENPTLDNLNQVLALFEFLEGDANKKLFSLLPTNYGTTGQAFGWHELTEERSFGWVLGSLILGSHSPNALRKWDNNILNHIHKLEKAFALLKQVMISKEKVVYSKEEQYFIDNPFPLILISEAEDKIAIANFDQQEYRASQPLRLGEDITMLATDTQAHANTVLHFLKFHNKENISVVLFDDLKKSQQSKKRPSSLPYETTSIGVAPQYLIPQKISYIATFSRLLSRLRPPMKQALFIGALSGALLIYPLGLMFSFGCAALSGAFSFMTLRYTLYRQKPLTKSNESRSVEEEEAYKIGILASHKWKYYLQSYLCLSAWKHPSYFGAGLYQAKINCQKNMGSPQNDDFEKVSDQKKRFSC